MKTLRICAIAITVLVCPVALVAAAAQDGSSLLKGLGIGMLARGFERPIDLKKHPPQRKSLQRSEASRSSETREFVRLLQEALNYNGYDAGVADGVLGVRTRRAISAYQLANGGKPTGILTPEEGLRLLGDYAAKSGRHITIPQTAGLTEPSDPNSFSVMPVSFDNGEIHASRLFAGPDDYPPTDFAAYGILAFRSQATSFDRDRHIAICKAYMSSIRSFRLVPQPISSQMVTVWPVQSKELAATLTSTNDPEQCNLAVEGYGMIASDLAIRRATSAGVELDGVGPFLLAWSPPQKMGAKDAIVLVADLSSVNDYDGALGIMLDWVRDIERDPALWSQGWSLDQLQVKVRMWFDRRGTQLLSVFGVS